MNHMICSGFDTNVYLLEDLRFIISYGFVWKINAIDSTHVFYHESVKRVFSFNGNIYLKCGKDEFFVWLEDSFVRVEQSLLLDELGSIGVEVKRGAYLYRENTDEFPQVKHELLRGDRVFVAYLKKQILLATYDDGFVFYDYGNKSVVKYNLDFEVVQNHEFLCERALTAHGGNLNSRYFVVLLRSPGNLSLIQVFDTSNFAIASSFESESSIKGVFQYQLSDKYAFFCADHNLMRISLETGELTHLFEEKAVSNISLKENYAYLSFSNDARVYVYDTSCESLILSVEGPPGFEVSSLEAGGADNCVIDAVVSSKMSSGLRYAAFWKDSEIRSSLNMIIEKPIYTVSIVPREDGFSLNILIDNSENYSIAARHALAALDECIYEHGLFMGRAHSPEFTGVVEWQFKNGGLLSVEQRDHLKKAGTYMLEEKYSMFKGAATGDDCSLSISFD